jgi:hypothetical protein
MKRNPHKILGAISSVSLEPGIMAGVTLLASRVDVFSRYGAFVAAGSAGTQEELVAEDESRTGTCLRSLRPFASDVTAGAVPALAS